MDKKQEVKQFFLNIRSYLGRHNNHEFDRNQIYSVLKLYESTDDISMESLIDEKVSLACEMAKETNTELLYKEQGKSPKKLTHLVFNADEIPNYRNVTKLFIPIKYTETPDVIEQIYSYLIFNNIKCETKVSSQDRSDNFVVRLYDLEDVDPFIQFCNQNNIIKENLKRTNPFICTKDNIGVTQDDGIKSSFNQTLSHSLAHYINACSRFGELREMGLDGFSSYLIELMNKETDEDLKFDYLCVLNSVNCINDKLDPVEVISNNIVSGHYNL